MAMIKIVIGQLKLVAVLEGKPSQVPSRKKIKAKERRETMNVRKKPNTIEAEKVRTTPTIGKAREVSVRERGGERDDWRFFIFIIFHPENVPIASCWASAKPTIHVVRQTEKQCKRMLMFISLQVMLYFLAHSKVHSVVQSVSWLSSKILNVFFDFSFLALPAEPTSQKHIVIYSNFLVLVEGH